MFHLITVINLVMGLAVFIMSLRVYLKYHIAIKWLVYLLYSFAISLMVVLTQIRTLFVHEVHNSWTLKLVLTVVCMSKIYFVYCVKTSSIKK